ncbi:DUF1707 domain-containing protein [Nocardioides sp. zg-1228]|uniref:DUF1707 SHOCT-like domain-containing protein n=1 Tax=Nocardioides sp. zg-1228 TaxID=2763008 RepID=UPI001642A70F|nr:DUF1707 domain-containing protein [Nocardioides sp. zg-1228]MBC2933831.1 DUF1707 domain-containing protein [Nocardioides sp. zg-1228]QSF58603.1 DUF1707 domain-containing protein [Nocardioides sp. zg-1228]
MTAPDPRVRIADSDRERAMADLALHYTDGRLDHEEYDERLDAIWTARTRADLAVLFSDLPRLPAPHPTRAPASTARTARARTAGPRFRVPLLPVLVILLALSVLLEAPLFLLIFPVMWFAHRRRGPAHQRRHGHTDYRRPGRSHGW